MSDISKIKVSGVEYNIKDSQAREDLGTLGTRVTELEQHGGGGGSTVELDTTLTQSGKAADAKAVGDAIRSLSEEKVDKTAITLGVNKADGLVYIFISGNPVGNGLSISGMTMDEITVVDGTMTILALANAPTQNGTTLMIA